jgi:hypothetical protein
MALPARLLGALAILLLVGLIVGQSAGAKKRKPPRLPDLILTEGELTSDHYLFAGEGSTVSFTDRTKNIGKAKAKRSATQFVLKVRGARFLAWLLTQRPVPALKPRESHGGSASRAWKMPMSALGGYVSGICANANGRVKEKLRTNNCVRPDDDFGVIPRKIVGTVDGAGGYLNNPGVAETWHATMTWVFQKNEPPVYDYELERADVSYKDSGVSGDCTFTGEGGVTIVNGGSEDKLQITYGSFNRYLAVGAIPATAFPLYPVHVFCAHGGSHDDVGPGNSAWLFTGFNPLSPTHGYTSLSDSYTAPDGSAHWTWSLTPQ